MGRDQGTRAVKVVWDDTAPKSAVRPKMGVYKDLAAKAPGSIARKDGDVDAGFGSGQGHRGDLGFPLSGAFRDGAAQCRRPRKKNGTLEIWGGHQFPNVYQMLASQIVGITPDKVHLHVMKTGGSFGRRAVFDGDVVVESVYVAKALRAPVKVEWTREDDMRAGRYRPSYVHTLKAGIDGEGKLVAWSDHIVGQSIMSNDCLRGHGPERRRPHLCRKGQNLPYAIPNQTVQAPRRLMSGVPVLWWRSVGSTHTAFAAETFIDEVAEAAGPVTRSNTACRCSVIRNQRHAVVPQARGGKGRMDQAACRKAVSAAFRWRRALARSLRRLPKSCSTDDSGGIKVERVVAAVDCGLAVDPDQVRAQVEGGIGFGLGAILGEEITLTGGKVDQGNFDVYTPLRIDAMPVVEVHILASANPPTGMGEPGVPPIRPAVANAVYQATKKRVRTLPFAKGLTA